MTSKEIGLFAFNVITSGGIAGASGSIFQQYFDSHEWLFAACGVVGYIATTAAEFAYMVLREHYNNRNGQT